jgi:FtsP/CotA-like multicopper oxidase with cupredoxin domain
VDECHLSASAFWVEWLPCTNPKKVAQHFEAVAVPPRFDNQSDEAHPVHLHRHTFELTRFAGRATAGVRKDVIVVPAMKQVEVDFTANNPGPTLFHCHQQLHMDYGFMTMVQYGG